MFALQQEGFTLNGGFEAAHNGRGSLRDAALDADLRRWGAPALPDPLPASLAGPIVLMALAGADVSKSLLQRVNSETGGDGGAHRLLKLLLTDGIRTVPAVEIVACPILNGLKLGGKLALRNARVVRGTVLLEPQTVSVLGGAVRELQVISDAHTLTIRHQLSGSRAPIEGNAAVIRQQQGQPGQVQPPPGAPGAQQAPQPMQPQAGLGAPAVNSNGSRGPADTGFSSTPMPLQTNNELGGGSHDSIAFSQQQPGASPSAAGGSRRTIYGVIEDIVGGKLKVVEDRFRMMVLLNDGVVAQPCVLSHEFIQHEMGCDVAEYRGLAKGDRSSLLGAFGNQLSELGPQLFSVVRGPSLPGAASPGSPKAREPGGEYPVIVAAVSAAADTAWTERRLARIEAAALAGQYR